MKYYVENFETEEIIAVFDTEEERNNFINENVVIENGAGFLK